MYHQNLKIRSGEYTQLGKKVNEKEKYYLTIICQYFLSLG